MPGFFRLMLICVCLVLFSFSQSLGAAPEAQTDSSSQPTAESSAEEQNEETDPAAHPMLQVNEAWNTVWEGQQEMLNDIRETALKLSDDFSGQTGNLSLEMQPFEREGRRLLVFATTFKGYPKAMEAVYRRMGSTLASLNEILAPINSARSQAEALLERVNSLASNLPNDTDKSHFSPEMQAYINEITRSRLRLTAVLAQYNSILPSLGVLKNLEKARTEISASLPELWKDYYLQKPVPWLSPSSWSNLLNDTYYSWQAMLLRLPVELPTTAGEWSPLVLRFFICLLLGAVMTALIKNHWLYINSSEPSLHIFNVAAPWIVGGMALSACSIAANGEFFRFFLALGCYCLILGEIYLAWDLRRLQFPQAAQLKTPLMRLMPLAICAYALLYAPIPQSLVIVLWSLILVWRLYSNNHKKNKNLPPAPYRIEGGVLECYAMVLWICLLLSISGLQLYSMGLYIAYVAFGVGLEFSFAGIALVNRINEHLPQEGARAALFRFLVALAAPFVLVVAVCGMCLWVAILPGGLYLLAEYALKGITVGATQFNVIQVLLILTAFYLTRTVVAMGTRLLAKLPSQGGNFDTTLITPMQTVLTYAAWAFFGLFVLRSIGMQLSSLAMVAGGLSVGVGFGMQTIVNNFISGLILIFGRTLQVGDVIDVGGTTGRVRKISVRATMVETYDNAIIFVPNSEFMANRLINWTSFSRSVRREIVIGVAYGSDTELVMQLLIDIAGAHPNVLKYPAPSVIFADFAASSLNFQLRFWVQDYEMGARAASDIRLGIDKTFAEKNIEIAFPQLDVHIKSDNAPQPGAQDRPQRTLPKKAAPVVRPVLRQPRLAKKSNAGAEKVNGA